MKDLHLFDAGWVAGHGLFLSSGPEPVHLLRSATRSISVWAYNSLPGVLFIE
jgi:hypothetical protein